MELTIEQSYNKILDDKSTNLMDYFDKVGDILFEHYSNKKTELKGLSALTNNTSKELTKKYYEKLNGIQPKKTERLFICKDCLIEKLFIPNDNAYVCPCCGDIETILIQKMVSRHKTYYKRIVRFKEWLRLFQGKMFPNIPDDILKQIKDNITLSNELPTHTTVKKILKKLKLNKLYDHTQYITNLICGIPNQKITTEQEHILIKMFLQIIKPWEKYKSKNRKNFFNYNYVLHKFCELLEWNSLLPLFTLHKQRNILEENDRIWKHICDDLNWKFKSSFKMKTLEFPEIGI